ncbi:cobyrinic acid a,c-diamide synthase [Haladaptatus sp. GCM10025707]|uniref:cobyrinic acid a,c-diamide synthase n=1 Tax=unclassified Haladaptatus TaxID=2622732 RepID=UPI0023E8B3CD|nr:cobyrinic acid a,c-diamide synthase [Haladaptatus sp. QDMS2]
MRGVVLGGTSSGVGKTVATMAVCRALTHAGYSVQPAKAGPDFIDPSHHATLGAPSRTLDPWLQGRAGMRQNYARGTGDVCVVEGMMGLYDGDTSTAQVAAQLELPVVLVVDASAGMESVAATALGFKSFAGHVDVSVDVVGVIASRAHPGRHVDGIRAALPSDIEFLGYIPPRDDLTIPERHLGLHLGDEAPLSTDALDAAADGVRGHRFAEIAREPTWYEDCRATQESRESEPTPRAPTVAVAHDQSFCFIYPATLERLRRRATVVPFSPTAGDELPPCDGVYIPGGYPERHAADLAESQTLSTLATRAEDGLPVFGECGGFMVLADTLTTTDGTTHEMAGVLPAAVTMHERYQALDHVELRARGRTLTAMPGERLRGHEFHYSAATAAPDATFAFDVERGTGIDGREGLTAYQTLGTYAHFHPESGAFDRFLDQL